VFGIIKFYQACKKNGIKPILGTEAYLVEDCEKAREDRQRHAHHLVILAKNHQGWLNICRLTTYANRNFYFKPRLDLKALEQYK
jgi:DNA polymerase-3 subunit alpha